MFNVPGFQGATQGTGFCFTWPIALTEKTTAHFECLRATKNTGEPLNLPQHQRDYSIPQADSKESSWVETGTFFQLENYT